MCPHFLEYATRGSCVFNLTPTESILSRKALFFFQGGDEQSVLKFQDSSRLYLLIAQPRIDQLRLPVHDFTSPRPVIPLRKINNLATS
jgi:hypothetical protein